MFFDRCDVCDVPARGLCGGCRTQLQPAPWPSTELGLDGWMALCSYDGIGRELIHHMKFRHRRAALNPVAEALSAALAPTLPGISAVVPVPAHRQRRRERGFDLADLLAQRLAQQLGLRRAQPLCRIDRGSQRHRARTDRAQVSYEPRNASPRGVLLVDDVVTTGATMRACAAALRQGGTQRIFGVSIAVTPDSGQSDLVSQVLID